MLNMFVEMYKRLKYRSNVERTRGTNWEDFKTNHTELLKVKM